MPQPYRGTGERLYLARPATVDKPELQVHVADIALMWTLAEESWGLILAMMLRTELGAGLTMYNALTGTTAQRAVLLAIADKYLPDEFKADFTKLLEAMRRRATDRNKVVHGLWVFDPDFPDCLVLAPQHMFTQVILERVRRGATTEPLHKLANLDDFFVYKDRDFAEIEERLSQHVGDVEGFIARLGAARGPMFPPAPAPPA